MNDRTKESKELMDDVEQIVNETPSAQPRTLVEVWTKLFESLDEAEKSRIDIGTAVRVVTRYPQIKYSDLPEYHLAYFYCLREIKLVLSLEVESDPDCFKRIEDDAEANKHIYLNLITGWQSLFKQWEEDWDPTNLSAAVHVAALADARAFVLGETGMIAHLDQIGFQYNDEDAESVAVAVAVAAE